MTTSPELEARLRVERALARRFPTRLVPDLDRITDLLHCLGDPQRAFPSVHLTGTNGKTTTSRMIDALLRELGLRTGRYTSPHLQRVTERIAVDGEPLTMARFAEIYDEVAPFAALVDARHPDPVTFFELLTAMAFAAFADTPVDVAVVEVGLGGRWDATNVVHAPVAVLTPIDLDHTQLLGDTVAAIAAEKAGIIHPGALVVSAAQPEEAAEVIAAHATRVGAGVFAAGVDFGVVDRAVAVGGQQLTLRGLAGEYPEVFLPLHGAHQADNAACALAAAECFVGGGTAALDADAVRAAFAAVRSPGRLEVVRRGPTVLLDGAHNPAGARALVEAIGDSFAFRRLVGVVAMLADKDVRGVLAVLEPVLAEIVVTTNSSPRAMGVDELAAIAAEVFGPERVTPAARLDDALEDGVRLAEEGGALAGDAGTGVLVTGSIVTVGEARDLLAPRG